MEEWEEMVQLDHSILQSVLKPARYTGGEWNAVRKDWDAAACRFALALPDVYEVGMSNLGLAILYEILTRRARLCAVGGYGGKDAGEGHPALFPRIAPGNPYI